MAALPITVLPPHRRGRGVQHESAVSKSLSSSPSCLVTKLPGGFGNRDGLSLRHASQGHRPSYEKPHTLNVRAVKELTGSILRGEGLRFAVVAARFNEIVTRPLVAGALETFHKYAVKDDDVDLIWVPGSFEIPLVAQQMAKSGKYEAILAIGAVIRGSTTHYDAVAGSAASGLMSASLNSGVPVIFGILTTENMDQAIDRAGGKVGNKGAEAALTAVLEKLIGESPLFFKARYTMRSLGVWRMEKIASYVGGDKAVQLLKSGLKVNCCAGTSMKPDASVLVSKSTSILESESAPKAATIGINNLLSLIHDH